MSENARANNRRWFKNKYKTHPAFRQKRIALSERVRERLCKEDPEYARLVIVRGTMAKVRNQIEAHLEGIDKKKQRIVELEYKLLALAEEKEAINKRRELRKKGKHV
jgi:hypothetical protein